MALWGLADGGGKGGWDLTLTGAARGVEIVEGGRATRVRFFLIFLQLPHAIIPLRKVQEC